MLLPSQPMDFNPDPTFIPTYKNITFLQLLTWCMLSLKKKSSLDKIETKLYDGDITKNTSKGLPELTLKQEYISEIKAAENILLTMHSYRIDEYSKSLISIMDVKNNEIGSENIQEELVLLYRKYNIHQGWYGLEHLFWNILEKSRMDAADLQNGVLFTMLDCISRWFVFLSLELDILTNATQKLFIRNCGECTNYFIEVLTTITKHVLGGEIIDSFRSYIYEIESCGALAVQYATLFNQRIESNTAMSVGHKLLSKYKKQHISEFTNLIDLRDVIHRPRTLSSFLGDKCLDYELKFESSDAVFTEYSLRIKHSPYRDIADLVLINNYFKAHNNGDLVQDGVVVLPFRLLSAHKKMFTATGLRKKLLLQRPIIFRISRWWIVKDVTMKRVWNTPCFIDAFIIWAFLISCRYNNILQNNQKLKGCGFLSNFKTYLKSLVLNQFDI